MRRSTFSIIVSGLLTLPGCGALVYDGDAGMGSGPVDGTDSDTGPVDPDPEPGKPPKPSDPGDSGDPADPGGPTPDDLDGCRGDASDAQLADTLAITEEYAQSLHEMVACGALNVALCNGIVSGIITAVANQSNDATPPGWSYAGEGRYLTGTGGTDMESRFFLAQDTSFGQAGDPIVPNLFHVSSYLKNALGTVDYSTGVLKVIHDGPGPLAELMGYGLEPPNPLYLSLNDLADIQDRLGQLEFESRVVVDDERPKGTVYYHVDTPRMSARALLDGSAMAFGLQYADATRATLNQVLTVDDWSLEFVNDGPGALDGSIDFHVDGQYVPFLGTVRFDNSKYGDVDVGCP